MRICPKCGSRIDENAVKCPVCEEIGDADRRKYKLTGYILFYAFLTLSCVYVLICAVCGIVRFSEIDTEMFMRYSSLLGIIQPPPAVIAFNLLVFDLFIPLTFALFIIAFAFRKKTVLLIPFPIVGILAEFSQIMLDLRNYRHIIHEKDRFLYGIMGMELFSSFLVVVFFVLMIWMIITGFTISQSRLLVAFGFLLVASRFLLKVYMSDDPDIYRFVAATKSYMLLSALLLSSNKRYTDSRNM